MDDVGSDHALHTREEKSRTHPNKPSEMPSVQILVPMMLNHLHEGRLTLGQLVGLTARGPQRIYNTACKGHLAVGYGAFFTLVDIQETLTITDDSIVRKYGRTPYNGMKATG